MYCQLSLSSIGIDIVTNTGRYEFECTEKYYLPAHRSLGIYWFSIASHTTLQKPKSQCQKNKKKRIALISGQSKNNVLNTCFPSCVHIDYNFL